MRMKHWIMLTWNIMGIISKVMKYVFLKITNITSLINNWILISLALKIDLMQLFLQQKPCQQNARQKSRECEEISKKKKTRKQEKNDKSFVTCDIFWHPSIMHFIFLVFNKMHVGSDREWNCSRHLWFFGSNYQFCRDRFVSVHLIYSSARECDCWRGSRSSHTGIDWVGGWSGVANLCAIAKKLGVAIAKKLGCSRYVHWSLLHLAKYGIWVEGKQVKKIWKENR